MRRIVPWKVLVCLATAAAVLALIVPALIPGFHIVPGISAPLLRAGGPLTSTWDTEGYVTSVDYQNGIVEVDLRWAESPDFSGRLIKVVTCDGPESVVEIEPGDAVRIGYLKPVESDEPLTVQSIEVIDAVNQCGWVKNESSEWVYRPS